METTLFTPFESKDPHKTVEMWISRDDMAKFDALGRYSRKGVEVFDTVSGKIYRVAWASCGLKCRCAAVVLDTVKV